MTESKILSVYKLLTYSMEYVIITVVRRGKPLDQNKEERT